MKSDFSAVANDPVLNKSLLAKGFFTSGWGMTLKNMHIYQNKFFKKVLVAAMLVSFIAGGLAGGLIGAVASGLILDDGLANFSEIFGIELPDTKVIQVEEDSATIQTVEKAMPAVVSIIITKDLSQYYNMISPDIFSFPDFFEFSRPNFRFSTPGTLPDQQEVGGGTGFVISDDGLILTNQHVVSDPEAEYMVVTSTGETYEAEILAKDPLTDIAIVKVEATGLPVMELGDSDNLRIGQTVIAIGNALAEYHNSVTRGIVSGTNRQVTASNNYGQSEVLEGVIQTDAAINSGNSGGPLLNLAGEVVGVNTAVSRAGQLIGFAIPINQAKKMIKSVKEYGRIVWPWLGVRYLMLTPEIAEVNSLAYDYGALIVRGATKEELAIIPGSPADKAGLVENDIILEFGGEKLDSEHSLAREIAKFSPGDEVEMKIFHKDEEKIVSVTLVERED